MKKKIIAALSALAVCTGLNGSLSAYAAVSLGDVDGSGMINSADASMVLEEYSIYSTSGVSRFTNIQKQAADVNRDGSVNSVDASDIMRYYNYVATGGDMLIDYFLAQNPSDSTEKDTSADEKLKNLALDMGRAVNNERIAAGLQPMKISPYLMEVSSVRANELLTAFSHVRPDGSSCFTVLDMSKVPYYHVGENIAAGSSTACGTLEQWRNSNQGHWQEIMRSGNTHMGIGVVYDKNSTYGWYWEIFFAEAETSLDGEYLP
ncbi:MAG: hypothetical protein IJ666_07300 [Ruminococcus sp.]|nr:hypothetical protein [Ruminococcus sp.]